MGGRQIEQSKLTTFSLLVIAATCLAVALYWTRPVMVPFMLALFLTHLVAPLVDGLQIGLKAPRWAALLAAFLVIASLLSLLTLLLITSVGGLMENVDTFKNKALELIDQILGLLTRWNIDLGQEDFMARIQGLPILPLLQNTVGGVMNFLTTSVLVALFAVFMILGRQPKEVRSGLWGEMDRKIRRYLATKVITSAVTGILVGGILGLFGLDLAMVFGFMAFLLNFIPSVGSIIATLLPIPIAMLQLDHNLSIAAAIVIPGAIQFTIGNVIEPKLMGDGLDLHPLSILLALIFWGMIWGPVGMLMAAPMTAIMRIILARFETTGPAAELLAGRLPVSSSNDEIAAQDHAEAS
ncbi:MAG: AI-2E family transporter [Myxococcota bacterium]|nr:AI-2E family transporter [Myxococcota bacterium]